MRENLKIQQKLKMKNTKEKSQIILTEKEKRFLNAYRLRSDLQDKVDEILGVKLEDPCENKNAPTARSKKNFKKTIDK